MSEHYTPSTKRKTKFIFCVVAFCLSACFHHPGPSQKHSIGIERIVDLTHTLNSRFPFIPVKKLTYPFELLPMATLDNNGVAANSWRIHEHLGTHMDAPNHFIKNGMSLDEIPVQDLIVPLVVIDIAAGAQINADTMLQVQDIIDFEKERGRIPDHACVMMYSGWEEKIGTDGFVGMGRDSLKHYPGFSNEAVLFLLKERHIAGIGVDVLSFDKGIDENYTVHKTLFSAGKWGVECVANLKELPPTGTTLIAGAPKVGGATGGFSRLLAVW